jgi:diadenosine tetraphosphate (Ap4A) HIT family hydrolase
MAMSPKYFNQVMQQIFEVVKAVHDGVGYTIYFNKGNQTLEDLVGDDIDFCYFYSLEKDGETWFWRDVVGTDPVRNVTEEQLNRYSELRHYITRESHEDLGTTMRARTADQFKAMQETVGRGICPFCPPYDWKNPPIYDGDHWILKRNDFPYKHTLHHLVVILKEHGNENDLAPVSPEAWAEFGQIIQWAIREFKMPGGGIVIRFGHPDYNASTIRHLHAHIQVPDLTGNVKATFCKDRSPEEEARRQKRLEEFQQ